MADGSTIREFLVALGFKHDEAGLRRFVGGIGGAEKVVRDFAVAVAGMATAIEESIRRTARQFDNLYYLSQQTGVSVRNLRNVQFAFSQIGLTAQDANTMLSTFASNLRDNPGLRALSDSLVPGWKDARDVLIGLGERYRNIIRFNPAAEPGFRIMLERLGFSAEQIRQMAVNLDVFKKGFSESGKVFDLFKLNNQQAANLAVDVSRKWGETWHILETGFNVFTIATFPAVSKLLERFATWLSTEGAQAINIWAEEFNTFINKEDNIKAIEDTFIAIGTAIYNISKAIHDWIVESKGLDHTSNAFVKMADDLSTIVRWIDDVIKAIERLEGHSHVLRDLFFGDKGRFNIFPFGQQPAPGPEAPKLEPPGGGGQFNDPISRFFRWLGRSSTFGGSGGGPDSLIPGPDEHRGFNPRKGYHPASYTTGGDEGSGLDLLLRGFTNWWRGDTAFRPVVVIAEEFYTKFSDALLTSLGFAGEGGGGGGGGGTSRVGVAPGGHGMPGRVRPGGVAGAGSSENASRLMNYLMETEHLTKDQAAGIAGAMQVESGKGLDPSIVNPTSGATGIGQWLGSRLTALKQQEGWKSFETQLKFLSGELHGGDPGAARALAKMKANPGMKADEAARVWERHFERSGGALMGQRVANARRLAGGDTSGGGRGFGGQSMISKATALAAAAKGKADKWMAEHWDELPGMGAKDKPYSWVDKFTDTPTPEYGPGSPWGKGPPLGSETPPGRGTSIDSEHKVDIHVHGSENPALTARAVEDVQKRQSALHTRNLRTAIA